MQAVLSSHPVLDDTAIEMEQDTHSQQEMSYGSDRKLPEGTVLLNSAAKTGNWQRVTELISNGDVTAVNIKQSFLLQKLMSATEVSHQLVKDILSKLFSNKEPSGALKKVAQDAVVEAAKKDNWRILMTFLMTVDCVLEDETTLLSLLQLVSSSHTLTERPYLQTDVLAVVWRHSQQTILSSKDGKVHNIFVQLAARLNMWSRVCDILTARPNLNVLDRDGLSVLHRLVTCPDSRFDSLFPVLLKHGADVSIKNSKGDTVLHLAARHQRIGCVQDCSHRLGTSDKTDFKDFQAKVMSEYRSKRAACKLQTLTRLIRTCSTLDGFDGEGNTAVIVAAKNDNWEFLKLLLKHGARAEITDGSQRSVLHVLALKDLSQSPATCESLAIACVNGGGPVNGTDVNGCSPLHLAVQAHNWTLLASLVDLGAHVEILDGQGYNVLHRLATTKREHAERVCPLFLLLHQRGSDLNTQCSTGDTILHLAVMCENFTLAKYLIELGTNTNHSNREGYTVLHLLALYKTCFQTFEQSSLNHHSQSNHEEVLSVISCLYDKGVDLECRCSSGDTALQLAAKDGNWSVFTHLLQRGAQIYEMDSEGVSVMQRFVQSKVEPTESHSIFQLLLHRSAAINRRTNHGDSVLQMAAKHEKWEVVEYILRHLGGNADEKDSEGFTVFQRVVASHGKTFKEGRNCSFVRFLFDNITNPDGRQIVDLIHQAAASRNVDAVRVLVDQFEDVNETDSMGFTVLHRVAQCCALISLGLIRRLVERGAEINKRCPDGNTALHLAARSNNWMAVIYLLLSGAWANALDSDGNSVLHRLVGQSPFQCKQFLEHTANKTMARLLAAVVDKGAAPNQRDHHGNTPLHLAVKNEHWSTAVELLARGASLIERDSRGCTVLHVLSSRCSPSSKAQVTEVSKEESCENSCLSCSLTSDLDVQNIFSNFAGIYGDSQNPFLFSSHKSLENPFLFSILAEQNFNHLLMCDYFMDSQIPLDAVDHHGNTALVMSAKHNNWDITERLLLKDADVNFVDQQGSSVLHILASLKPECGFLSQEKSMKIVDLLLFQSVEVNARDKAGNTAIQLAAKHGNLDMVERLLDFQQNVNEVDSEGFTLLSRIALTASPKCNAIVSCLLRKGADVNIACSDGKTPLVLSVLSRNWGITSSLWFPTSNSNIDDMLQEQHVILHRLVEGHSSETNLLDLIRKVLWRRNDAIAQRNTRDMSAIQLAILEQKWDLVVEFLLCGGCTDIEAVAGELTFHVLAQCALHVSSFEMIQRLMPHRHLNINLRDEEGNTPLNILANASKWDLVRIFTQHGADVKMPDRDGWTAVHKLAMFAYWGNFSDTLMTLVKYGADINMAGPECKTPVMLAMDKKNWFLFWQMIQLGARYDCCKADKRLLFENVSSYPRRNADEEKLSEVIMYITQFSVTYPFGSKTKSLPSQAVFEKCVLSSNWTVAKVLLQCRPEIDTKTALHGSPLLHEMVSRYEDGDHVTWLSLLDVLLDRGLDINCRDLNGQTPIMRRKALLSLVDINKKPFALFKVLMDRGADSSMVDNNGKTVLTKVIQLYGRYSLRRVAWLLQHGLLSNRFQPEDSAQGNGCRLSNPLFNSQVKRALIEVKPQAVKILVECGAFFNCELSFLNSEFQAEKLQEADIEAETCQICLILEQAATQPRSLESLCRLAVSRCLPCGGKRRDTIMCLHIPPVLKEYLLFSDVLPDLNPQSEDEEFDQRFLDSVSLESDTDCDDYDNNNDYYDNFEEETSEDN